MYTFKQDLQNYSANSDSRVDEALADDGSLKPSWRYLMDAMAEIECEELEAREQKALRMLRDHGANHNNYSQSQVQGDQSQSQSQGNQLWSLDLLPHLIESDDWHNIETGLQERAELFNHIFSDLYGPRELISRGILPPHLVFGHAGFLRENVDIRLPGEHQIIVHATDMLRRANGEMCVLSDRIQAPSGFGYALENRRVMSRVLPSLFRDSRTHRLAGFFQEFRKKLIDLAPDVSLPRIVMLTPGVFSETYFEHAFLANYLGFSLVEGKDLVVQGGFVWLRSVEGLIKVNVIVRRVDDIYCDPVELKANSKLGVPGLLQVAREGNVAIVNPFGSGVLENPAMLAYLPKIAEHFLGHELKLGSVSTWWCGDPDSHNYVINEIDQLVIKPFNRSTIEHSVVVSELSDQQRTELINKINSEPKKYVAQEKVIPTQLPTLINKKLMKRSAMLRSFAVASRDASYQVMPGGMSRVNLNEEDSMISSRFGVISKDTWVLSSELDRQYTSSILSDSNIGYTQGAFLSSGIIENLFWMGRYAERAEHNLRFLRTIFIQLNGINEIPARSREILLLAITKSTYTYPGFLDNKELQENPKTELIKVILGHNRPGSVSQVLNSLCTCANQLKSALPADSFRVISDINQQFDLLKKALDDGMAVTPEENLDPVVSSLLALSGIRHENMLRDYGWNFLDLGRRIERVLQTVTLLRSLLFVKLDDYEEICILESISLSTELLSSYHRHYGATLNLESMLEVIFTDASSPRSLAFQVARIHEAILRLPETKQKSHTAELDIIKETKDIVTSSSIVKLSLTSQDTGVRKELDQSCARIHTLMSKTSELLSKKYFYSGKKVQQLNQSD